MSKTGEPAGGPAFPCIVPAVHSDEQGKDYLDFTDTGMSMRDWFAGKALTGQIVGRTIIIGGALASKRGFEETGDPYETGARDAYRYADAMLAERKKA